MAKKNSLAARYREARAEKKKDERALKSATKGDQTRLRALVVALRDYKIKSERQDSSPAAAPDSRKR